VIRRLERIEGDLLAERTRASTIRLLVDLVSSGWKSVDDRSAPRAQLPGRLRARSSTASKERRAENRLSDPRLPRQPLLDRQANQADSTRTERREPDHTSPPRRRPSRQSPSARIMPGHARLCHPEAAGQERQGPNKAAQREDEIVSASERSRLSRAQQT